MAESSRPKRRKRSQARTFNSTAAASAISDRPRPPKKDPAGSSSQHSADTRDSSQSTARDRLIEVLQSNPTKAFPFKDLVAIAGISAKTVSSIMTQLRDSPKYGIVHQPERGFWQFRERRAGTGGNLSSGEYFSNRYALDHLHSILQRMKDNPNLFSPFDVDGLNNLIDVAFDPDLVRDVRGG